MRVGDGRDVKVRESNSVGTDSLRFSQTKVTENLEGM
jgi:hypothetical protein